MTSCLDSMTHTDQTEQVMLRREIEIDEIETKEIQLRELGRQHDDKLNIIRSMATNNGCSSEQFVIPVNQSSTPFVLKQHRRSRSLSEVWLEHRPQGTKLFFSRSLTRKYAHKKALVKDEIIRTTKYVLTHQNLDAQSEVVTDFIKDGDLFLSSTCGVNVIFNDVKRLTSSF
ncbi:unnamed protein product [Adineta ricciae]|uniref:Kinesin-like protein Kif23 Arf6-interacting domain-containing protein n=1 Tax=Adineta ricciae TaxID=249248 RepID=A0A815W1S6_ADIRI|nr:unnamed protein product [Adineta ricciae]